MIYVGRVAMLRNNRTPRYNKKRGLQYKPLPHSSHSFHPHNLTMKFLYILFALPLLVAAVPAPAPAPVPSYYARPKRDVDTVLAKRQATVADLRRRAEYEDKKDYDGEEDDDKEDDDKEGDDKKEYDDKKYKPSYYPYKPR